MENVHVEPPKRISRERAFGARHAELQNAVGVEAKRLLAEYGSDPRSWPFEKLSKLGELDSRLRAFEVLGEYAKHAHNVDWSEPTLPAAISTERR